MPELNFNVNISDADNDRLQFVLKTLNLDVVSWLGQVVQQAFINELGSKFEEAKIKFEAEVRAKEEELARLKELLKTVTPPG